MDNSLIESFTEVRKSMTATKRKLKSINYFETPIYDELVKLEGQVEEVEWYMIQIGVLLKMIDDGEVGV